MTTAVRLLPQTPDPDAGDPRADASVVVALAPAVAVVAAALWRGAPWNTDAWKAAVPDTHPEVSPIKLRRLRGARGRGLDWGGGRRYSQTFLTTSF